MPSIISTISVGDNLQNLFEIDVAGDISQDKMETIMYCKYEINTVLLYCYNQNSYTHTYH